MKKTILNSLLLLVISFILGTCVEPISLNLKEEAPKLVVYGLINNVDDSCVVKLSYTTDYLSNNKPSNKPISPATAAKVSIQDNENNVFNFAEYESGVYVSKNKGKIGNTYTLFIELSNGKKYQSIPETLPYISPIDSIRHQFIRETKFINNVLFNDFSLEIDAYFQDPSLEENYYKWKWVGEASFRFDTYISPPPCFPPLCIPASCYYKVSPYNSDPYQDEITILSDKNLNGSHYQQPILFFRDKSLDVRFYSSINLQIAQYSLTKNAYEYWEKMKKLINNQGSIFDPAPFQILGNIYNVNDKSEIILGYFGASGVRYIRHQFYAANAKTKPSCPVNPPRDCYDCRNLGQDYSLTPPSYWKN